MRRWHWEKNMASIPIGYIPADEEQPMGEKKILSRARGVGKTNRVRSFPEGIAPCFLSGKEDFPSFCNRRFWKKAGFQPVTASKAAVLL